MFSVPRDNPHGNHAAACTVMFIFAARTSPPLTVPRVEMGRVVDVPNELVHFRTTHHHVCICPQSLAFSPHKDQEPLVCRIVKQVVRPLGW